LEEELVVDCLSYLRASQTVAVKHFVLSQAFIIPLNIKL